MDAGASVDPWWWSGWLPRAPDPPAKTMFPERLEIIVLSLLLCIPLQRPSLWARQCCFSLSAVLLELPVERLKRTSFFLQNGVPTLFVPCYVVVVLLLLLFCADSKLASFVLLKCLLLETSSSSSSSLSPPHLLTLNTLRVNLSGVVNLVDVFSSS
jgi:hypothetical protein